MLIAVTIVVRTRQDRLHFTHRAHLRSRRVLAARRSRWYVLVVDVR